MTEDVNTVQEGRSEKLGSEGWQRQELEVPGVPTTDLGAVLGAVTSFEGNRDSRSCFRERRCDHVWQYRKISLAAGKGKADHGCDCPGPRALHQSPYWNWRSTDHNHLLPRVSSNFRPPSPPQTSHQPRSLPLLYELIFFFNYGALHSSHTLVK